MKALQGRKRFLLFIDELALPPVAKDELGAALETEARDEPKVEQAAAEPPA